MIIIFVLMSLALFGSTQSASFECKFSSISWGTLGTIYWCDVQNIVNINSLDAAHVDDISGTHLAGFNNDNVEAFSITIGQVHYFPRGLTKYFKNLKGIQIGNTGLKEIHQSDLKDFPKLTNLHLWNSNLEILEENLFEFNPNLNYIYLWSNKISHIDPNVFDKLTNLKYLILDSNTCIDMAAWNSSTQLQNVIKTAKSKCTNSDYSNLEQKVKNLQTESKNLNFENLKEKLEKLENEIKNSKFPNFFHEKLQILNAVLIGKSLESKVDNVMNNLKILTSSQTDHIKTTSRIEEKMAKISDSIMMINKNYEEQNTRFLKLMKALGNVYSAVQ